ncbi:MAG TPA: hypothetical protein VFQ61_29840 [Polyangiaceae bacterium]|nr:hypothetical protein [Polyangiaceae bacterium]
MMTPASVSGPRLETSAGIAELGGRVVVWGRDLHHECLDFSFVQYLLFSVTGREFSVSQARVFERLWISTGYADARIWCNRIAAYMGSARVPPSLSMCAAIAASNSVGYGFGALRDAYAVQLEIPENSAEREAWLAAVFADRRVLAGYGRPIHNGDERIPVALHILTEEGVSAGPALRRAFWLHFRLRERKGIQMNIAAVFAAIGADFGLDAREFEQFMLLMLTPGYSAVYADQRERPAFTFLAGHQSLR